MTSLHGRGSALVIGLLGLILGAVGGAWFGSSVWTDHRVEAPDPGRDPADDVSTARTPSGAALDAPPVLSTRSSNADELVHAPASDCPLYGEVQRAHGELGIRTGWSSRRPDEPDAAALTAGLKQYEAAVRELPITIGRTLADAQNATDSALADAARGGLFGLLKSLEENHAGPLVAETRDAKWFDALFQRSSSGSAFADGASNRAHPDKALEDGGTLSFPAGVFRVSNLMREKDPFPRDVTVSGAGMNATLLVLSGNLATRGELVNLTLRDCTIHTDGNYLTDLRTKPASLTFERVRFIGFDMGAGSSCLLAAKLVAVRAQDCHFVGGYGRSPQHGQVFDVRSNALIARFQRCHFEQVTLEVNWLRPGATVVMIGCTLTDMLNGTSLESLGHAGLALDGCTIAYLPGGSQAAQAKDLNLLFPQWKERMER